MSTTKKASETKQSEPDPDINSQQSEQNRESLSDSEKEGQPKKKEGYSILSSLAKFMSREKSETPSITNVEEPLNENDNTETDMESESDDGSQQEPYVPEHVEVSSQTSDMNVRRSSTLNAITKAVEALKEVRRRVAVIAKKNEGREMERLQEEETQTSSSELSKYSDSDVIIHHDPHLMRQNQHLSTNSFGTTLESLRYEPHLKNESPLEPRSLSEQSLRRHRYENPHHDQPNTHVSFSENQVHDRRMHPEEIYNTSSRERFSNDDSLYNNDGVLFHSTPKPGKGNPRKKHPNHRFVKNANFQTEPDMEMKGTQTASPSRIMENDIDDEDDYPNTSIMLDNLSAEDIDTTVLAHRLLADREKCSKCDLFELMFLHEGEKMLNDRKVVEMFTRHMNNHLKRAKRESKKAHKKPRAIAEAEHLHDVLSVSQLGSTENIEQGMEMSFQNGRPDENNPKVLDSRRNEPTNAPIKSNPIASSRKRERRQNEDRTVGTNHDSKAEKLMAAKENILSLLRRKQRKTPKDQSILFNYLFKNGENCSEEVIIQRKHCKRDKNNDNSYQHNNEDGRYDRELAGNSSYINCVNHRNSERIKCSHVTGWCNNCNCWNKDCRCNDQCNYECDVSEFGSSTDHSHRKKLSSKEKRFKWLVKGMLAVLKSYHGVKQGESDATKTKDTKTESEPNEEKADSKEDKEKVEKLPEAQPESTTAEPPPSSSPTEETEPSSEAQKSGKKREGSVLSDIAFFMVKEEESKRENVDAENKTDEKEVQPTPPDLSSDKQDLENKPSSGQESISSSSPDEKLVVDLLSNWVRNGKICVDRAKLGSSGDEDGKSPKSFDLKDPKVQKFVQDILTAFCSEVLNHDHEESSQGSECDYTDDVVSSCPSSHSEEMKEQFCELIKSATVPQQTRQNPRSQRKNSDAKSSSGRGTTNECRNTSYFYPFCNNNNNNAASFNTQFCYCRSSFGGHGNNNTNYCAFPTQENSRRHNTASCNRAQMRQECVESSRRKKDSQQRPKKQSQTKATRNPIPRHVTRENPLCVCNLTAGATGNHQGNVCDAFTYVVPQARMFWRCSKTESNE